MRRAAYDEIAEWHDEGLGENWILHDLALPNLLELAGDVEGRRICDLGCGQGVAIRAFAKRGAKVVGVDISEKMLEFARRHEREESLGVEDILDAARKLSGFEDASFDGALCNMALMDIPDLDETLTTVARVLRDEGWFVFAITHPVTRTPGSKLGMDAANDSAWEITGYFEEGFWRSDDPRGIRGKVGSHHRTVSGYLNALSKAGFHVERAVEPRADGRLAERLPKYREVPAVLAARCGKVVE
ncbi:MAG: class I SAM-dependent methyltransferase [Rubrobacter sp.]|nr:class I SAM-dependent methyltransferase [Rubrobacter sp.]